MFSFSSSSIRFTLRLVSVNSQVMEIFAITDAVKLTATATQYLGFSKLLRDTTSPTGVLLSITAGFSPVDAIAPPISRPRAVPRCPPRRKRRTRKRSATGDSDDGGDEPGLFSGDFAFGGGGDDDGGGRGGGDNGRRWWNFEPDGDGDDGDSWKFSFAYDFMNEVIIWIVLSSCMNFAFKRLIEIMTDGIEDPSRRRLR